MYILAAILCYYEGWVSQSGNGGYPVSSIPPKKCTHLVYAFALPAAGGKIQSFTDGATILNKMVALKTQNANLKVMISIGGWSADSATFSNVSI